MERTFNSYHMGPNSSKIDYIKRSLSKYLQGKEKPLNLSLISFFSRGHLLIEDLPGLGKTTLAIAIAKSLGLTFGRIQCTSDLLPTDITGLSIYNKTSGEFEFHPGPIFNNIVLCDEINRATPKTQSALLEAMEEKQVTIEGRTYKLPEIVQRHCHPESDGAVRHISATGITARSVHDEDQYRLSADRRGKRNIEDR